MTNATNNTTTTGNASEAKTETLLGNAQGTVAVSTLAPFKSPSITAMSADDIKAHVAKIQGDTWTAVYNYRRRTRHEFSIFMLEARTTIKTLRESVPAPIMAGIFTQYQIVAATGTTSEYTPFIRLIFGKLNAEGKKKKFAGQEFVKWEADESFARYFNFFEVIDREFAGPDTELLAWVIDKGGPAAIVKAELERKRDPKPSEDTIKARNELFLKETDVPPVFVPYKVPEGAGDYMTVVVRKESNGFSVLGISKLNGKADFERMAADQFDTLSKAKADREAEAARLDKAKEAVRAENAADPEKMLDGMTKAQRRALMQKMVAAQGVAEVMPAPKPRARKTAKTPVAEA